jgi:predicted helicase
VGETNRSTCFSDVGSRTNYCILAVTGIADLHFEAAFPRNRFYKDFWQWADWGKELMDLHIGYESVTPAKLKRIDVPDYEKARKAGLTPKYILKADKEASWIVVDSETTLTGIPPKAWKYRLGNRSALEWILDQY